MITKVVSSHRFVDWHTHDRTPVRVRHPYHARLEGKCIVVEDETGQPVEVNFAASTDMRTCYAYVEGVGFIGGWSYPHRKMPWSYLVDSINRGIIYREQNDLPKRAVLKKCPHCGKEL